MKNALMFCAALLVLSAILAGCFGRSEAQEVTAAPVRTPRPTFTPTPATPPTPEAPAASDSQPPAAENAAEPNQPAAGEQPAAQAAPADAAQAQTAIAVVNEDLINIRRGPGLQYPVLKLGMRGDQYTLTGRSADDEWWQICCIEELPGWITQQYVDADGPVDGIAVADPDAEVQALVVAPPTLELATPPAVEPAPPVEAAPEAPAAEAPPAAEDVAAETPAEESAPAFLFTLAAQEQFPENNNLMRVFLYVSEGDTALPGYSLRVTRDGAELPVTAASADAAGMTWPTANPRQRFQNMKVEFPGVQPAGVWEIQLIDGGGAPVGPVATFTLEAADTNRELYVRYEKP